MKAISLIFFCASAISATAFAGTPGEVPIGGYLREATLQEFSGNTKKLSGYHGKPLVINGWASWCAPCRAEMGSLERLYRRYGGKQLNVIGISTDDDRSAAEALIKKSKITFVNYLDSKVFLENMLGANMIPLTILVDADGRVVEKVHGAHEWDSPKLIEALGNTFHIKLPR